MKKLDHQGAHILVIPYPAQGHMLALLDLTHHLATHGLTITILVTPKNLPLLNPLLASSPSIKTLVLTFPPHPNLPPGVENVKDIGNHGNLPIINSLAKLEEPIIKWFKAHDDPPVAILADFFLGWTHNLASKLDMPGSPSFSFEHLPTIARRYKDTDPEWNLVLDGFVASSSSWGWVVNTFEHLECKYMEYLSKMMGQGRVYGVGPVSFLNGSDPMPRGNSDSGSSLDVLKWLDGKPNGSVLYVCFGSQKFLGSEQMKALGIGLEESGVHYVWVVKQEQGDPVCSGSGRGIVVNGWAPQVSILSHAAVGGFLSHCGWNSVLEAIVAGVMILTWPMEADQYVNAKLLVEDHGVAVRVCEGNDTVPDSVVLARKIAESMSEDKGDKLKAKQLKALEAAKEGGSSSMELDRLVKELSNFEPQKKVVAQNGSEGLLSEDKTENVKEKELKEKAISPSVTSNWAVCCTLNPPLLPPIPPEGGVTGGSLQLVRETLAESTSHTLGVDDEVLDLSERNLKQCRRKICDGQYTAAMRVLSSSGVAPYNDATLQELKAKHPFKSAPSLPDTPIDHHHLIASETVVLDRIKSFLRGTSCGRDGLRDQHLLDCLSGIAV
nr:UDP-glycosyltransferase 89A2-like [Tanacetum cinerariifolium]